MADLTIHIPSGLLSNALLFVGGGVYFGVAVFAFIASEITAGYGRAFGWGGRGSGILGALLWPIALLLLPVSVALDRWRR